MLGTSIQNMQGECYCPHCPFEKFRKESNIGVDSNVEDLVTSFVMGLSFFKDEAEQNIDDTGTLDSLITHHQRSIHSQKHMNGSNSVMNITSPLRDGSCGLANSLDNKSEKFLKLEELGKQEVSGEEPVSRPSHDTSTFIFPNSIQQPKSALRGSSKKNVLESKPKLHVRWAPDVMEPACSSVSHTVTNKCHLKHVKKGDQKQHKHLHKGKSNHGNGRKKHEKKAVTKSRYSLEECIMRAQSMNYGRNLHLGLVAKGIMF